MAASGYAPWTRVAGIGLYGSSYTLHDYLDIGSPNVLDSITAEQYSALAQAQAWIASTAPMFVLEVAANDWSAADPTVTAFSMVGGYASYEGGSPPSGFPAVTRVQSGEYTITSASSYNDEAGVSGPCNATFAGATITDASSDKYANVVKVSATEITLYHRDWSSGTLAADETSLVEIV